MIKLRTEQNKLAAKKESVFIVSIIIRNVNNKERFIKMFRKRRADAQQLIHILQEEHSLLTGLYRVLKWLSWREFLVVLWIGNSECA